MLPKSARPQKLVSRKAATSPRRSRSYLVVQSRTVLPGLIADSYRAAQSSSPALAGRPAARSVLKSPLGSRPLTRTSRPPNPGPDAVMRRTMTRTATGNLISSSLEGDADAHSGTLPRRNRPRSCRGRRRRAHFTRFCPLLLPLLFPLASHIA